MTLKRNKKREIVRKQLLEKEQETTHSLVSKFSKEMLNLIQTKEREVLVSILSSILSVIFFSGRLEMASMINSLLRIPC